MLKVTNPNAPGQILFRKVREAFYAACGFGFIYLLIIGASVFAR